MSATWLGALLETADPPRARTILETAIEHATTINYGVYVAMPLVYLARMGTDARSPQWATQFRTSLDLAYDKGDTVNCLLLLDLYTQALATTDRAETAAVLAATVGELSPHTSNPISVAHRRDTNARLLTQLGEERLAELTAHGEALRYEDAVALARAELDRAIANDDAA